MGVKEVSARWTKTARAMKKEDQIYALRLAEMAKMHSSEAFYALDDPLEAAVFSVLIELMKGNIGIEEKCHSEFAFQPSKLSINRNHTNMKLDKINRS